MIDRRRLLLLAPALAVVGVTAWRSQPATARPIYTGLVAGVGAGGFDVVAYHTGGRATEGLPSITAQHRGATWRFASQANQAAFNADPERYAPAYGGHCAWAAAQGYLAKGDPRHWQIVQGRLYLNYDASIHRRWQADIPGFIRRGDANWPRLAGA